MNNHSHLLHPGHNGAPVILQVDRVGRTYADGSVTALNEVSLEIRRGEYVAIMGPSGSGKSTLLNLLGTLDRPTTGELYFEGHPLSKLRDLDAFRSRKIGFVFQSFYLLPTLTAVENVQIPMSKRELHSAAGQKSVRTVGIGQHGSSCHSSAHPTFRWRATTRGHRPSSGNDPPLLLADEPTGNLDSRSGNDVLNLFDELHTQQGKTLIVITHSQEVADRAERIIWIRDGGIVHSRAEALKQREAV